MNSMSETKDNHMETAKGLKPSPSIPLHIQPYLMISTYSRSLPLLSLHLRYMTEASTLAGEKVLGSFSREITLSKMVLKENKEKGDKLV